MNPAAPELLDDLGPARPIERMPAAVARIQHAAGHGQDVASLIERAARRDERPAALGGLDNDDRP